MQFLIALLVAALMSLSGAEAAGLKASGPVIAAPQAIVVAKPKPKKPKGQQPYMTIQMQDAMITSW